MPQVDYSGPLLAGEANYKASDFAGASGSGGVNLEAVAQLNRGLHVALGADALLQVDAYMRKFLAADLTGQANAAARVAAEVRAPLNLFDRAGIIAALDARAEAAASIQLGIGLNIGDFLALARDGGADETGMRLLEALLSEPAIKGGVMAKAAAAAMAYASLECTASLFGTRTQKPGITVAASAGLGLKAGAGFRGFLEIELTEPRRLVRRIVDIIVDDSADALVRSLGRERASSIEEFRPFLKLAFRACFEVGQEIAATGSGRPIDGRVLAQRCVQVALEELQRTYFGTVIRWARDMWLALLGPAELAQQQWAAIRAERYQLADRLDAVERLELEDTPQARALWRDVFEAAVALAKKMTAGATRDRFLETLAATWAAVELLFALTKQASEANARAQLLGRSIAAVAASFDGPLPAQPPREIKDRINAELGGAGDLDRGDLANFLVKAVVLDAVTAAFPELGRAAALLAPVGFDAAGAIGLIVKNANRLSAADGSAISLDATFTALTSGLRENLVARIETELRPILADRTGGSPEAVLYFEEVLLPAVRACAGEIFGAVARGVRDGSVSPALLSEACSTIVLNLLTRSMVVTADVILDHTLRNIGAQLRDVRRHVDDPNGLAHEISRLTRIDRRTIAGGLEETLDILSAVFKPLPAAQRARIRELAVECGDFLLSSPEDGLIAGLRDQTAMANPAAGNELALELGKTIMDRLGVAVTTMIALLEQALRELIDEFVRGVEQQLARWEQDLTALISELQAELDELVRDLQAAMRNAERAWNRAVDRWIALSEQLASRRGREKLQAELTELFFDRAKDALASNPIYRALPAEGRRLVRRAAKDAIRAVVEGDPADRLLEALGTVTAGAAEFVDELRDIPPGADLTHAVLDLLLDRLEDGLEEACGDSLGIDLSVDFEFFGRKTIRLGRVRIRTRDVAAAFRRAARDVEALQDHVAHIAAELSDYFGFEELAASLESNRNAAEEQLSRKKRARDESRLVEPNIEILSPRAGTAVTGDLNVVVRLTGVPASALGRDAGVAQRVFVWLGDRQIELGAADVDAVEPVAAPRVSPILNVRPKLGSIAGAASRTLARTTAKRKVAPIGRRARISDLQAPPESGALTLRLRVAEQLLKPGINSISVWVTDAGGERRTSVRASFVAERSSVGPARPHFPIVSAPPKLAVRPVARIERLTNPIGVETRVRGELGAIRAGIADRKKKIAEHRVVLGRRIRP